MKILLLIVNIYNPYHLKNATAVVPFLKVM